MTDDETRLSDLFRRTARLSGREQAALRRLRATLHAHIVAADNPAATNRRPLALAVGVVLVPAALAIGLAVHSRESGAPTGGVVPATATSTPAATATPSASAPPATPSPSPQPTHPPPPAVAPGPIRGPRLDRLEMVDPSHGWALHQMQSATDRSALLTTADGGATWTDVTPPGATSLNTLTSFDAQRAWVVAPADPTGNSTVVYRTADAGRTWLAATLATSSGAEILRIDATHLFFVGMGYAAGSEAVDILRSDDAGATWHAVSTSNTSGNPNDTTGVPFACDKGVAFKDTLTAWAAGSCNSGRPFFDVSRDGGVHWSAQTVPLPNTPDMSFGVPVFLTAADGFFDASAGQAVVQYLYSTHDGGAHWTYAVAPGGAGLVEAVAVGDAVAVTGDGSIVTSADDGRTWSTVARHPELAPSATETATLDYLDRDHAFYLLTAPAGASVVYRSSDGGRTLQRMSG